ncbi:MAG: hypothetical protein COV29_02935 [Candidatus Yanofskybacteria bacterium CG10_big_fil_rev_8_21_14_0_10_36_16]|uniref:Peptidase M50 domain-containing protein n=1 Tax=Candidatus Yanofskybacteria bacterium CG10_big_fil_rev_8_21_14_0_10_36_16 TaxID=1975096 RepID=A0A2J0Q9K6_9BACT|nr:MAG: hypothetical protein COV29_02935 [Candidatus Yanofskybacteria bacterium CG10_big_fil_rev_8_21_14_0_10_36_16]
MLTAIIFIIVLGILIFVHELGHFLTAKRSGMKVEEFGFGFPPRIWGIKKGETMYSINWIPFGGFVKILGEDGEDKNNPRSFASKPAGVRSKVIVAGVVMNLLLAFVLLTIGNAFGLRVGLLDEDMASRAKDLKIQIIEIAKDSPADEAGIVPLDEIFGFLIGGEQVRAESIEKTQETINEYAGEELTFLIRKGEEISEVVMTPRIDPPEGQGATGIALAQTGIIKYPWYQVPIKGIESTAIVTINTFVGYGTIIKNLFTTGKAGVELTGPVGIAIITGQATRLGITYLMQFTALISVNLAVLNIIPFPALDGGRLLFIIIEKVRRRPISRNVENIVNTAGFALLILLMLYVTTKDIFKFF